MISCAKLSIYQTSFLYLSLAGAVLLMTHSKVEANESPKISFYENIDLIKDINNEYSNNIKLISKKLVISIKRGLKPLKTKTKRKSTKKSTIQKEFFVQKQVSNDTRTHTYNCLDHKSATHLRNELRRMQHCYDSAPDVASKKVSFKIMMNDLSLELDSLKVASKYLELGLDPLGLSHLTPPHHHFLNRTKKRYK